MTLYIRMALYFTFAALASQGIVVFDEVSGEVTFQIQDVALILSGAVAFVVTFITSRIAKARNGLT